MKPKVEENTERTTGVTRQRVQLDFSPDAFERLEELRRETNATTKVEVIRDALRIYEWMAEQSREGRVIELKEKDGTPVGKMEAKWLLR